MIGGLDMQAQAKALAARPHVVVATPGRLRVRLLSPRVPSLLLLLPLNIGLSITLRCPSMATPGRLRVRLLYPRVPLSSCAPDACPTPRSAHSEAAAALRRPWTGPVTCRLLSCKFGHQGRCQASHCASHTWRASCSQRMVLDVQDLLSADAGLAAGFGRARFLVLDEADRLLEPSFERELAIILAALPAQRQTLLFSATLTRSLIRLQAAGLRDAFTFQARGL